jgi:hypothetical protein
MNLRKGIRINVIKLMETIVSSSVLLKNAIVFFKQNVSGTLVL